MYAGAIVDGYEMRQRSLTPVNVGPLKVQLVAEYRGTDLSGKVLRIENKSDQAVELTEAMVAPASALAVSVAERSEEHTSELQSLMRISYAVFCLKKKTTKTSQTTNSTK